MDDEVVEFEMRRHRHWCPQRLTTKLSTVSIFYEYNGKDAVWIVLSRECYCHVGRWIGKGPLKILEESSYIRVEPGDRTTDFWDSQ